MPTHIYRPLKQSADDAGMYIVPKRRICLADFAQIVGVGIKTVTQSQEPVSEPIRAGGHPSTTTRILTNEPMRRY